jgi:predicted acylesterase/phospholipase RssA
MYETLVLSGGGIKGFGMLGILHNLTMNDVIDLKNVKNFVGSSIGGIICALLCFDFHPIEIFFFFLDMLPIKSYADKERVLSNLKSFVNESSLQDIFERNGKTLVLTSFDKQNRRALYYSKDSHPTKKVIDAIQETSNIPFISGSNDIYIDGCLCSPFPLKYAKDHFNSPMLGIYTFAKNVDLLPIPNLYDDLKIVLHQLYNTVISYEIAFATRDDLIIKLDNQIPFEIFHVDFITARDLFLKGMVTASFFFK